MPAGRPTNSSGIYALTCPETGRVRYVGQAVNISRRYSDHCRNVGGCSGSSYYHRWMASLSSIPGLCVLEETDDLNAAEKKWIAKLKKNGDPLVNTGAGGEGYPSSPVYHLARRMRRMFKGSDRIQSLTDRLIDRYQGASEKERERMDQEAFKSMERTS